jgi:hypothetical protein
MADGWGRLPGNSHRASSVCLLFGWFIQRFPAKALAGSSAGFIARFRVLAPGAIPPHSSNILAFRRCPPKLLPTGAKVVSFSVEEILEMAARPKGEKLSSIE